MNNCKHCIQQSYPANPDSNRDGHAVYAKTLANINNEQPLLSNPHSNFY